MTSNWEEKFARWAKPPSESEEERCSNAIKMIKDALNAHPDLKERDTSIILQGSFRNNTNIKRDSDIDICIRLNDSFFTSYPEEYSREDYGLSPSDYTYTDFKSSVEKALKQKFGSENVHRGNKAFFIDSNSYRVKSDVLAALEYRWYIRPPAHQNNYHSGVKFITDDGREIINWPEQHYENGIEKNKKTDRRFKRTVRIFKNLRNEMAKNGISSANNIPSFLLECLCWNVPNEMYDHTQYTEIVKQAMVFLYNSTKEYEKCKEWGEVSELKYLFRDSQPWTYKQVNSFISDAWNFVGF